MLSTEHIVRQSATLIPLARWHDLISSSTPISCEFLKQQPANIKAGGLLDEVTISGQKLRRTSTSPELN